MLSKILTRVSVVPKRAATANARWLKILAVDPLDPVCSEVRNKRDCRKLAIKSLFVRGPFLIATSKGCTQSSRLWHKVRQGITLPEYAENFSGTDAECHQRIS